MSMSTHVIAFAEPDEQWQKMKSTWDACKAAKVEVPEEVEKFFVYCDPDPAGVEVKLPARKWGDDCRDGFEIQVGDIPKHCKVIRFYNSW